MNEMKEKISILREKKLINRQYVIIVKIYQINIRLTVSFKRRERGEDRLMVSAVVVGIVQVMANTETH